MCVWQFCNIVKMVFCIETQFYTDNGLKMPIDIVIGTIPLRDTLPVMITQPMPQPSSTSAEGSPFDTSAIHMRKMLFSFFFITRSTARLEVYTAVAVRVFGFYFTEAVAQGRL
jgi:hypothetical protein